MRVLFYQPAHTGHHFAYLARMMPGFVDLPIERIVVTSPEALRSEEFAKTLAAFADRVKFVTSCTPAPRAPIRNARHRLRELSQAIRAIRPDHVAVCYADGLWEQALLRTMLGMRPWPRQLVVEGWLYRGRFGDPEDRRIRSRVRRWLFVRLLRAGLFRRLHIDHELLYDFGVPRALGTPTELVLTPNPVVLGPEMSKADARRELGIATEGQWVSLSGVIARFKGAHLLLDAYRIYRTQRDNRPARLLLAGPHEPEIRAMLARPPYREWTAEGQIVSLDRYLDEREMYASAAASDLVTAPYPRHQGRSSIILWAAAAGRRSLGTDASCVGHVIRQERLGETCEVSDTGALAESISNVLRIPWTDDDARRVRRYAEFHRVENYQRMASQRVRDRLREQANDGRNH